MKPCSCSIANPVLMAKGDNDDKLPLYIDINFQGVPHIYQNPIYAVSGNRLDSMINVFQNTY